jgi:hypothetical protein
MTLIFYPERTGLARACKTSPWRDAHAVKGVAPAGTVLPDTKLLDVHGAATTLYAAAEGGPADRGPPAQAHGPQPNSPDGEPRPAPAEPPSC